MWDLAFLDDRHILVPAELPMCEVPCLLPLDCFRGDKDMPLTSEVTAEAILALQLPPLLYGAVYTRIGIWSSLNTVPSPADRDNAPFCPSHTSRLMVVSLTIENEDPDLPTTWAGELGHGGRGERLFAIPASVFLSRLDAAKADQNVFLFYFNLPRRGRARLPAACHRPPVVALGDGRAAVPAGHAGPGSVQLALRRPGAPGR